MPDNLEKSGNYYEFHTYEDLGFPIIFHYNHLTRNSSYILPHWHKAVELLCFIEGEATVYIDAIPVDVEAGELAVVNSCALHTIHTRSQEAGYYCLIVDYSLCEEFGLPIDQPLCTVTHDGMLTDYFAYIHSEMESKGPQYKPAVKSYALLILSLLYRQAEGLREVSRVSSMQLVIVRKAIAYISGHFLEPVTTGTICESIGLSKYYFCRIFKEFTGHTVTGYINKLRCDHARRLIASGKYNVSESAALSGFQNPSYFTKVYRRHIGALPSSRNTNGKV